MFISTMANRSFTEDEIQEYIRSRIPDINDTNMIKIREKFIYEHFPLDVAVELFIADQRIKEWIKSKDKHYYRVSMTNGGVKYVCMCEEMVKAFYPNRYKRV